MFLYGASGHAKVIIDILKSQGKKLLGLIDDHVSLSLDIKIFLKTIEKVFKREGINSRDSATMEPFTGNSNKQSVTCEQ